MTMLQNYAYILNYQKVRAQIARGIHKSFPELCKYQ